MKKLYWILGLIALYFIGDRLVGYFFQQQIEKSQFRYSRMYAGNGEADILIVGNSRGLNFYQPYMDSVTNQNTFSLCYYSMPPEMAIVMTKDYIDQYPKVKKILVELTLIEMSDDKLLPGFATYMNFSPRVDSVIKVKDKQSWNASQLSHLFRYNNEVFQRAMYYRNKLDDDWYFDRTITEAFIQDAPNRSVTFKVNDTLIRQLAEIGAYAKTKGIEVYYIMGPFFPTYPVHNLDKLLARFTELTGYPVINYSRSIQDPYSFTDYLHANLKGGRATVDLMIKDGILNVQ
ncbi:hypothetical protein [Gynurincola endophyticus]|uniref:hypothetical protein n=1 Tax=Gynurincola endophyticus TaxID=2479004 RepID=UPI000F8E8D29|nr:hypothetical protein [Gynurincola endophyticus]